MGRGGFEPPKQVAADLQSVPFGHSGICPFTIYIYITLLKKVQQHLLHIPNYFHYIHQIFFFFILIFDTKLYWYYTVYNPEANIGEQYYKMNKKKLFWGVTFIVAVIVCVICGYKIISYFLSDGGNSAEYINPETETNTATLVNTV